MVGEWRTVTVRDLVGDGVLARPIDGNHGDTHPKGADFLSSGIPFIMASDLVNGRVDTRGCAFISEEQARSLRKGFARPGDVLISHKATMGRTALVGELDYPFIMLTPQVTYYRVLDPSRLERRFLKFYFDSPGFQALFETWGQKGSTRAYLGITAQLDLPIVLPPIAEQRAIAHVLGTLDDKIELNRRLNATADAIARALFKSWFVDFDPVRAKAAGRYPGPRQRLADLFPDSFEDSELGEIPKGWGVATLSDSASLNPEAWSKETRPSVVAYVDLSNTKWGRIEAVTLYKQEDAPSRAQRVLRLMDTIVGTVRPGNGSYAFISDDGLTGSTGFAVLRPLKADYGEFVYLAATAPENIDRLAHLADGAAYPAVRPEVVASTQAVKPPAELIRSFSQVAHPLLATIAANDRESRTLAALRDTLLPKLISRELRIEDPASFRGDGN